MFAYLGKYGNHYAIIAIFIHTRLHVNVSIFVVQACYIVNIFSLFWVSASPVLVVEHMMLFKYLLVFGAPNYGTQPALKPEMGVQKKGKKSGN